MQVILEFSQGIHTVHVVGFSYYATDVVVPFAITVYS